MAPVLCIFLMMAFSKTLEDEWTALRLSKAQFVSKENSPRSTGQLVIHRPSTFTSRIIFYLICMLYVDNGTFVFESRNDTEKGITLLSNHFDQFGLDILINSQILNPVYKKYSISLSPYFIIHKNFIQNLIFTCQIIFLKLGS